MRAFSDGGGTYQHATTVGPDTTQKRNERQDGSSAKGFFYRDPQRVARQLLGKLLVRRVGRQLLSARVVEAEAYLGEADPAAHAFSGYTERNAVLFGPPGYAYGYLIYGQYYCLNVSCLPEGKAGCVLFRALEPVAGIAAMARNRGGIETESETLLKPSQLKLLTSGPGRLSEAFAITRARDNGKDLTFSKSDLYLADDGFRPPKITVTPRIGLTKAVEWPLRFVVAGNVFVSGPRLRAGKTSGR